MPILVTLKTPPITLGLQGDLDEDFKRHIRKELRIIEGQATDGKPIWIVINEDSNIAYIKEITDDQYREMEAEKARQLASRIERPRMVIPGKGRKPN